MGIQNPLKHLFNIKTAFSHCLLPQNIPSWMLDKVLNIPLDYLSCFAVVLIGIHRKFDIC